MEIKGYNFPDDLYYDQNHYWAKVEDDEIVMGTTDLTQQLAGEITFVDVPEEGDEVTQGKPFGSIESGKWVGRVYAPVSGEVITGNRGSGGRARADQRGLLRFRLDLPHKAQRSGGRDRQFDAGVRFRGLGDRRDRKARERVTRGTPFQRNQGG